MPTLNTYSDVIAILCYAPHCNDVADSILARLELEAAGDRLMASMVAARMARNAAWIGKAPVERASSFLAFSMVSK